MARTIFVMRHSLRFALMSLWSLMRDALTMLLGPDVGTTDPAAAPPDVMLALEVEATPPDAVAPRRLFGIEFCEVAWRFIRCSDLGGGIREVGLEILRMVTFTHLWTTQKIRV